MNSKSTHIKSLSRHGQTQKGRVNSALLPENIQIDQRNISDFILFAKRYSNYIKFYPLENPDDRKWKAFWSKDISAVLAGISAYPIDEFLNFYKDLKKFILNLIAEDKTTVIAKHFRLLFQLPIWIVQSLIEVEPLLHSHPEFKHQFKTFLEQEIEMPLEQIVAYFKGADDQLPSDFKNIAITIDQFQGPDDIRIPDLINKHLRVLTSFENANLKLPFTTMQWTAFYNNILKNTNPYIEEISVKAKVYDALNYNLLTADIEAVLEAMLSVQSMFKRELEESLNNPKHTPHYGLWLCFAKLYQFQRAELNQFTTRHLEYYYKEILKQELLKPRPTQAHVIFQLNKDQDKLLLHKGTLLKAGKDSNGKEIRYQLLDDLIVSQAKVSEIRSVFIPPSVDYPIAAIRANTYDGIEEELEHPKTDWHAVFQGVEKDGNLKPKGRLGFAIADKDLFLKEGDRVITITIDQNLNSSSLKTNHFEVFYTSKQGWEKIKIRKSNTTNNKLIVEIESEKPAFVHFNPDLHLDDKHTDDFQEKLPVLKVLLKSGYWNWKNVKFNNLKIHVKADRVKDLFVKNKNGVMDISKPFPIFGVIPDKLPSVLIGSNEIFSKTLEKMSVNIQWQEAYNRSDYFKSISDDHYDVRLEYLVNGSWQGQNSFIENMYKPFTEDQNQHSIVFDQTVKDISFSAEQTIDNQPHTSTSKNGYIKIHVDRTFGHDDYPTEYSKKMIKIANGENVSVPNKPYDAIVDTIDIDYQTKSHVPHSFFELQPFGFAEIKDPKAFVHEFEQVAYQYIGISNLKPQEKVRILFQILSGTADPLADPANIEWSYLKDNSWETNKLEVEDKTNELSSSSIISFTVPKQATNDNTLFPKGLYWLRMAIPTHYQALNHLVGIHAQASLVEFVDQDNHPGYLNANLEPQSISKLAKPLKEIKSVIQPYEGFNRRGSESPDGYYTRVSERLRHKNRAITLWDYEHLILQHFPNVYRVKCLNHTRLDNANRPGHVTIVALPKIQSLLKDPTKPYTDKQTRLAIYELLKPRISPFVCLHIVQPKLEAIQIECTVKFDEAYDDLVFYKDHLQQALIAYLTPWAFEPEKDVHFGGRWYKADLINFIDEQPYVSYVKNLKMYHHLGDNSVNVDQEVITASTPRSVLVSENNHLITPLENNMFNNNDHDCNCKTKELI